MPRPQGYALWTEADGSRRECDTITCSHCQKVVFIRGSDPGGFCRLCMKPVCSRCANYGRCDPFEKQVERFERWGGLTPNDFRSTAFPDENKVL